MSLYQKYRPTSLSEVIGNEQAVLGLDKMLGDRQTCPHAFLLTGPTGCGKTTIGRIIANRLNCVGEDFKEINTADFRGIDTVREVRGQVQYVPLHGDVRIWLVDECHKLTNDAQNAILKLLEDPPSHVYFILATTDPQKLLPTIKGRCSTFDLSTLNDTQMLKLLRKVVKEEGGILTKAVYEQIITDSFGHPRNALQILEQVLNVPEEERLATAQRSAEKISQSIELCRALIKGESWKKVAEILKGLKQEDPESIRRHVMAYCQSVLLSADNQTAAKVLEAFLEPFYNTGMPGLVFACYSTYY